MHPVPLVERRAWEQETADWLSTLPPAPVPHFLTGVKPRPPDPRDFDLADFLPAQMPEAAPFGDLLGLVRGPALSQGAIPACVSFTAAMDQSLFQYDEERIWRVYDAMKIHNETGALMQGRYATDILNYGVRNGFPRLDSGIRDKLLGYAFVQTGSGWFNTIVQWMSLGRPVWGCYLVPSSFGGETSGGSLTSGYHESLFLAWRTSPEPALLTRNSWGDNWGIRLGGYGGFTWMPVSYLQQERYHRGLVLFHTPTDVRETNPPPPPPPVGVAIHELLDAGGTSVRETRVGSVVQVVGAGFDTITPPVVVRLGGTPTNVQGRAANRMGCLVVEPVGVPGPVTVAGGPAGTILARSAFSVTVRGSDPAPPPPVGKIIVTAEATGSGAGSITKGQTLTIGNVSALLLVTDVKKDDATPPDPPDPTPTPTTLTVVVSRMASMLQVRVKSGGSYVRARVVAEWPATIGLTVQEEWTQPGGGGASPAQFRAQGQGVIRFTATAENGAVGVMDFAL